MSRRKYSAAHHAVRKARGSARALTCVSCGEPGEEWALRADLHVFGEARYSDDVDDYDPMCKRCHALRDWPAGERERIGREGWEQLVALTPPEQLAAWRAAGANGMRAAFHAEMTPEQITAHYQKVGRAGGKIGGSKGGKIGGPLAAQLVLNRRRECKECGFQSRPMGIGRHQQVTGHVGWADLPDAP